jgi:hypothetical protein
MTSITSISIPSSVKVLESAVFFRATLVPVHIPVNSQLTHIDARAFFGTSLKSIAIPALVRIIDELCFSGCLSLTSVTFSDRAVLTRIGDRAFFETGLHTLTLPSSLKNVNGLALCGIPDVLFARRASL